MAERQSPKLTVEGSSPSRVATNMTIKKVWVTDKDGELYSLSIESSTPELSHTRIKLSEMLFPANPTEKNPLRHTVNVGLFDIYDLQDIYDAIGRVLYE